MPGIRDQYLQRTSARSICRCPAQRWRTCQKNGAAASSPRNRTKDNDTNRGNQKAAVPVVVRPHRLWAPTLEARTQRAQYVFYQLQVQQQNIHTVPAKPLAMAKTEVAAMLGIRHKVWAGFATVVAEQYCIVVQHVVINKSSSYIYL